MKLSSSRRCLLSAVLALVPVLAHAQAGYLQTNLVSDIPGAAAHTDSNLVNAWGIASTHTGPWWVNANGMGLSLVYDSTGAGFPPGNQLIVTIPPPQGGMPPSTPTGIVANETAEFQLTPGHPAVFLFATEDGTISGWNSGTSAILKVTTPNAVYKGLTVARMNGQSLLYAANFHAGTVDVFDGNFNPMSLGANAFQDPTIPAGYAPFNVQAIAGSVFVAWAKQDAMQHDDVPGAGFGYVDAFSPAGALLMRLEHGNWMNAPWGMVMAPGGFGPLSNKLLVGQFGSGQIASFNPQNGKFDGLMTATPSRQPVAIDGLWGIRFGNGGIAGSPRELFFAAGPDGEMHGLFGKLTFKEK